MGIERHLFGIFVGESTALNKKWVVKAKDIEDATGKVLSFCKVELQRLEDANLGKDIDIDLKFLELEGDVSEI